MIIEVTRRLLLLYPTTAVSIGMEAKPSTDQDGGRLTGCRNWPYIDSWNPLNDTTKQQNSINTSILTTANLN